MKGKRAGNARERGRQREGGEGETERVGRDRESS